MPPGVFKNLYNPHLEVAEEAKKHDFPVTIFPCNGRVDIRTILLMRRFLEEQKIEIIHTHNYKSNFYGLIASFGLNVPLITTCHTWFGKTLKMRTFLFLDKCLLKRFDKIVAVSGPIREEALHCRVPSRKISKMSRMGKTLDWSGLKVVPWLN